MDKKNNKNIQKTSVVEKQNENISHEDYGYDFIPGFNEWLNIDEQKEKVEELEDL